MEINVNTDNTIQRHQGLEERVSTQLQEAIARFDDYVRRVDVHLSNENSQKHEDGSNSCTMEALVSGYAPVVVHAHADNLPASIAAAITKLKRALDSTIGKLNDKRSRESLASAIDTDVEPESDKNLTSGS